MPTVSTHLPEATYKRLRKRIGRRQNASTFVRMAIEEKLAGNRVRSTSPDVQRIASSIQELLEDEMDIRVADERMARLQRGEERVCTSEEVWRELGI